MYCSCYVFGDKCAKNAVSLPSACYFGCLGPRDYHFLGVAKAVYGAFCFFQETPPSSGGDKS